MISDLMGKNLESAAKLESRETNPKSLSTSRVGNVKKILFKSNSLGISQSKDFLSYPFISTALYINIDGLN